MKGEHKQVVWSNLNVKEQRVEVIIKDNEHEALMDGLGLVLSVYSWDNVKSAVHYPTEPLLPLYTPADLAIITSLIIPHGLSIF